MVSSVGLQLKNERLEDGASDNPIVPVVEDVCTRCERHHYWVIIGGNSLISVVKILLGLVGRSNALFADGIHSLGDVVGAIVTVVSIKIAAKKTDDAYPYGYGKIEFVAASVIYITLSFVGLYIFTSAVHHLFMKVPIRPHMVTIVGAILSLVVNELMYRQGVCVGTKKNSPSIIAAAHENRADMWSSLVILVGIIGARLGAWFLDPLAAIMVSWMIFKLCFENLRTTIRGLMDSAIEPEMREVILKESRKYEGIEVTNLRTREVGRRVDIEIDARVDRRKALKDLQELEARIRSDVLQAIGRSGDVVFYFSPAD